jgi:putative endonuclease
MKSKPNSYQFGLIAETIASLYLQFKFYKIIARRMRNHAGEIDIIALKRRTLIFIEVKARINYDPYQELISYNQQYRTKRAAALFLAKHPRFTGYDMRFDLIVISKAWPIHIKNIY